jgi:hypothetical protein
VADVLERGRLYPGVRTVFGPAEIASLRMPSAARRRKKRLWQLFILLLTVGVLASTASVIVISARPDSGPRHPDAWDPRVQPYVDFVENQRGLVFEQPVYVDFLDTQEFGREFTSRSAEPSRADAREIDRNADLLRALGLASGDLDLVNHSDPLRGSGVIGYYSYVDERISLRGTDLTPALQSILVRELTRALEDQRFDLRGLWPGLEADPAKRTAFVTLLEGDAARVETAWRATLTAEELAALEQDEQSQDLGSGGAARIPPALKTLVSVPVAFGEALLAVVVERRGARAVDNLFLTPPTTQEQLLDPFTLVEDRQGYLDVKEPPLADGDERLDGGTFGAISWLVMLAERLPAKDALRAADGWGGDAYVAFEHDGLTCVTIAFAGDTPQDLAQMSVALRTWVQAADGSAKVRRKGALLTLESCGQERAISSTAKGGSRDAVALAVARSNLSVVLAGKGIDALDARCAADRLAREMDAEQLRDLRPRSPGVRRELAVCRSDAPGKG